MKTKWTGTAVKGNLAIYSAFLVDRYAVVGVLMKADDHGLGGGIAGVDRPVLHGSTGLDMEIQQITALYSDNRA